MAEKALTVIDAVESRIKSIAAVLPSTISPARFIASFKTVCMHKPEVMAATKHSVVLAVMQAANDGLMPDNKQAAIVIRNSKRADGTWGKVATYQRMVSGLITLLYRTGRVATVEVALVREGETFEYEAGDTPRIKHVPNLMAEDKPIIAAYSIIRLKDGSVSRCVMSSLEIDYIMRKSPQGFDEKTGEVKGMWKNWPGEMAKKTVIHRHVKMISLEGMPAARDDDEVADVEDAAWTEADDGFVPQAEDKPIGTRATTGNGGTITSGAQPGSQEDQEVQKAASATVETGNGQEAGQGDSSSRKADDGLDWWRKAYKALRDKIMAATTKDEVNGIYVNGLADFDLDVPEQVETALLKARDNRLAQLEGGK